MAPDCTSSVGPSAVCIDQLSTGVARLDGHLRVQTANPALCELLEIGARRLQGMDLTQLAPASPELLEGARHALGERCAVQLRDVLLRDRQGESVPCAVTLTPIGDAGLVLEVHAQARGPELATARLSESLRGFAHEVKNPLAGLRGAAQLLRRRVAEADLQELAELIIAEADRLAALANRLLQSSGKPHLAMVNIHEVLERVYALFAAEESAPRVLRDFDPSLPPLHGDADRLTQLLLNLGRNALEAGARSLILRSRVEHSARVGERVLRLALRVDVVDDGRGVAAELADSLYLPMVSGRADGSGLGLALCQEIAREHGGGLSHRSRPGETTFSLLLPYGESHA